MKNKYNNKTLIGISIVIVIILIASICLFIIRTINLNTNITNNRKITEDNSTNDNNTEPVIGYYRTSREVAKNQFTIIEIELKEDKTVNYIIGSTHNVENTDAKAVMEYSGTYTENEQDVILTIESVDKNCVDGKYVCKTSIKLKKIPGSNNLIGYSDNTPQYSKINTPVLIK